MKHCGPRGDSFFIKLINKLIPQGMFGVELSDLCLEHDRNTGQNPSELADRLLKYSIARKFKALNKPKYQGFIASNFFYCGVSAYRLFGLYKND